MGYLLAEPALRNQAGQLAFHPHWLGELPLRVCFRHGARSATHPGRHAGAPPASRPVTRRSADYLRQLAEQR